MKNSERRDVMGVIQKWPNILVLVRHGEAQHNKEREMIEQGILPTYTDAMKNTRNADVALSKEGIGQSERTADFLHSVCPYFDTIFTSPFQRAYDTAQIIARQFSHAELRIEERVREKELGVLDGLTQDELKQLFPYEYERRRKEAKYYYRPIGGESYPDVNLRVWSFLSTLVREQAQTNILIVSHSAVMLSFRKLLEKLTEEEFFEIDKNNRLYNCGIITYRFNATLKPKPKLVLEYYNKKAW